MNHPLGPAMNQSVAQQLAHVTSIPGAGDALAKLFADLGDSLQLIQTDSRTFEDCQRHATQLGFSETQVRQLHGAIRIDPDFRRAGPTWALYATAADIRQRADLVLVEFDWLFQAARAANMGDTVDAIALVMDWLVDAIVRRERS